MSRKRCKIAHTSNALGSKGNSVAPQFGRNVDDDGPNIRRYKFETYVKNNFRKERNFDGSYSPIWPICLESMISTMWHTLAQKNSQTGSRRNILFLGKRPGTGSLDRTNMRISCWPLTASVLPSRRFTCTYSPPSVCSTRKLTARCIKSSRRAFMRFPYCLVTVC